MSKGGSDMILYWGSGSTPCWRVMLVLAEKGLKYESIQISFDKKEHKSDKILAINPRGQVPTFKHGEIVVNESAAICDYLESIHKEKFELTPSSKIGPILQRKYETQNLEKKLMPDFLYYFWMTKKEEIDQEVVTKKEEALKEELKIWDGYLKGNKFIMGDDFTMADVFLFPLVAWAFRLGMKKESYPNITNYYDECLKRPSVKESWPPHWNEGPSKMDCCKNL